MNIQGVMMGVGQVVSRNLNNMLCKIFLDQMKTQCKIFYRKTLEHLTVTQYIFTIILTIDLSKWGGQRGLGHKNNINYLELVTVEGRAADRRCVRLHSPGYFHYFRLFLSKNTENSFVWWWNSRLFLSSFIAAGEKNIMRETQFNWKYEV